MAPDILHQDHKLSYNITKLKLVMRLTSLIVKTDLQKRSFAGCLLEKVECNGVFKKGPS